MWWCDHICNTLDRPLGHNSTDAADDQQHDIVEHLGVGLVNRGH